MTRLNRNHNRTLRCSALLVLLVVAAFGRAGAEASDPTAADVFIVNANGGIKASFAVGGAQWTHGTQQSGQTGARIFDESGGLLGIVNYIALPGDFVLINEAPNSLASPAPDATQAPFSIVSFDAPLSDPVAPLQPGVLVAASTAFGPVADGDTVPHTVKVDVTAVPGPALDGDTTNMMIHWSINGDDTVTSPGSEASFFLMQDDTYAIEVWAEQNGASTQPREVVTYTIDGFDLTADVDDDGIPDIAEELFGGDPMRYTDVLTLDADRDGTPDFLEVLCQDLGSDPTSSRSTPRDTDGDGWSDCQETWRGTNTADAQLFRPDVPTASTPFGVELLLSGDVFEDAEQTRPAPDLVAAFHFRLEVEGVDYDSSDLPTPSELSREGLDEADLPARFRLSEARAALAAGTLPLVRVPAAGLGILQVEGRDGVWQARRHVAGAPDLLPPVVTEALAANQTSWTTAEEWLDAYAAYLRSHLVRGELAPLSPATGHGLALFEGVLHSLAGGTTTIQLREGAEGRATGVKRWNLENAWPTTAGFLDALDALVFGTSGGPLDGVLGDFADAAAASYDGGGAARVDEAETSLERIVQLVQGPDADERFTYIPMLLYLLGDDALEALTPEELALVLDPQADADADFRLNADEVLGTLMGLTSPLLADSDGDGLPDGVDECPASPVDECLALAYQEMDNDGDGVIDALDNCADVANADQSDRNGDGNGDACPRLAWIVKPSSHLRIFAGTSVVFESDSGGRLGRLDYQWDFGPGVPPSQAADPGAVRFDLPGNYTVRLDVSEGSDSKTTTTDTRIIEVQGVVPPPIVDAGGPYEAVEGEPVVLAATVISPVGEIANTTWQLGDGGKAGTNPVEHVYAQGEYVAVFEAHNYMNRFALDEATVIVEDSVPAAAFRVEPAPEGRVGDALRFIDESTAFDGIAQREWTLPGSQATAHEVTHVLQQRGMKIVRLDVTDGDGSRASVERTIAISSGLNLLLDTDADGMPDDFERDKGLLPLVPDAEDDLDLDTFRNGDEYRTARDPNAEADQPLGAAGTAYDALVDEFQDGVLVDRWSLGLQSPLSVASVVELKGSLSLSLDAPVGEPIAEAALVLFPTATVPGGVLDLALEFEGVGSVCIALIADEDDATRVEVCIAASVGARSAQLRFVRDGAIEAVGPVQPLVGAGPMEVQLIKQGALYAAILSDVAGAIDLGQVDAPELGDGPLRFVLGSRHAGATQEALLATLDALVFAYDRDEDGLTDAQEDIDRNGQVDPGETDPASPDTDDDGVLDGIDNCALVANGPAGGPDDQGDADDDGTGDACECSYTAGQPPVPDGDLNRDGRVDGADYTVWADGFGRTRAGYGDGDLNCDGNVDGADYTIWADGYGDELAAE